MRNVFVLGLDERNHEVLKATPSGRTCRFHQLLDIDELQSGEIDVEDELAQARDILDSFDGSIDAIVGYWDFPVTLLVPILCAERGLPSADLEAVLKCEHKFWSRTVQSEVTDAHPRFDLVDLDSSDPSHRLRYPLWMKPVKSASSELAFRIDDDQGFQEAVASLREGVDRVGRPFEQILQRVDPPPAIAKAGPHHCLAEEALRGVQAAVEGYVHQGRAVVYAVLDSVDYPGSPAFLRHQYPSGLPEAVQKRIRDIAVRVIEHHGLDNSTFSVEFFYDPVEDAVDILEINPRHSQTHAELFELVDGFTNHERMLRLGLGESPVDPGEADGEFSVAAEWYYRRFEDGTVTRVPTADEIKALEASLPGVRVRVVPSQGQRLSELPAQDSYSFELAKIVIGAADETEMRAKYERCVEVLRFDFADEGETAEETTGR